MNIISKVFILVVCLPTLLLGAQRTQKSGAKTTGIYSDMYYNEESGDVVGVEMFVVYARGGYYVVFQESEGVPDPPVVVAALVQSDTITFVLPADKGRQDRFRGVISPWGITGTFNSGRVNYEGSHTFKLKRKESYWQESR